MRANIARLLFVPAEFLFLCGVEPASSLYLTFMIPCGRVNRLKTMARTRGSDLIKLAIDKVYVDEEEITVSSPTHDGEYKP